MGELSAHTNETATLSIRSGWTRVYVDQVTPSREVRMSVQLGQPFPLHAGSSSKSFLAFLPAAEQEEYLSTMPLRPMTEATITTVSGLRKELAHIRKRGFAKSLGERQAGAASIAAPIFDHLGQPVASLSVCGPIERFTPHADEVADLLLKATAGLSHQLGYDRAEARTRS